jgi:hypothetical protein
MNRDSLATLVVPLVASACCLGLPIIASVAVGATVLVLGLGLPIIASVVVGLPGSVAGRSDAPGRRKQHVIGWRHQVGRLAVVDVGERSVAGSVG